MIAMIFEYWFDPDSPQIFNEYLEASDEVRAALIDIDGFHSVERFESSTDPGKYVAIGFFDDETAVSAWRNHSQHRHAQAIGRHRFFTDYRIRMARVIRDYGPAHRDQAPVDSRAAHDIEV